ncbi:MAG TPA: AgmX/PglI C-terminal domain-containing protein, partial [Polyangiaceae bacterium]
TAPSASVDVAPSTSTNAVASASASATPNATAAPNASALLAILSKPAPQDMQGICGASVQNQLQKVPGNGACGGVGAPLQPQTAHPAAVVNVSLTSGAAGDDHVAAALRPRFRNCANQALAQDPSQQGKLVIAAAVAANGEVTTTAVASNTGLSGNSAQCMARIVRNAQFPAGAARTIMIAVVQTKQSP